MPSDVPALDTAIGLAFVFFVLALLASAINEVIAQCSTMRATKLEAWLAENLGARVDRTNEAPANDDGKVLAASVMSHPTVYGLTRNGKKPSYIPSDQFVTALVSVGMTWKKAKDAGAKEQDLAQAMKTDGTLVYQVVRGTHSEVKEAIDALPDSAIKWALKQELAHAGTDMDGFRRHTEQWFDDAMQRLSGEYKRWAQKWLYAIGLVVAVALNADTFHMATTIWRDPGIRGGLVTQAGQASQTKDALDQLHQLALPLGWGHLHFPPQWNLSLAWQAVGILVTAAAAGLGAPFWFDALTRLGSLRSAGPKPKSAA